VHINSIFAEKGASHTYFIKIVIIFVLSVVFKLDGHMYQFYSTFKHH